MNGDEQVVHQLTISLLANGGISITGPISDTVLCYGLLECAKDALRRAKEPPQQERSRIQVVPVLAN